MRVLVVGGGKVGSYLAGQLFGAGHVVTIIELDERKAGELADSAEALVIAGDGTDVAVLTSAAVERVDWLIAVTGLDEVNLVACELGSTLGAARTLARLNDPRNRPTFAALGIPVVAVTDLISEVIEREVDTAAFERVSLLGAGALSMIEVEVPGGVAVRRIDEISLPPASVIVAVLTARGATVPGADSLIAPGDKVIAVTTLDREPALRDALCGSGVS